MSAAELMDISRGRILVVIAVPSPQQVVPEGADIGEGTVVGQIMVFLSFTVMPEGLDQNRGRS